MIPLVPNVDPGDLDIRDYLKVLRRRKFVVAVTVAIVVAVALSLSYRQTKVYRASAELLIQPQSSDTLFNPNTGQANPNQVPTDIEIVKSQPVRDKVRAELGFASPIGVSQVGQTNVISVSAESTIPRQAARVADAYATAYVEVRRTQAVDSLLAAAKQIQGKIDALKKQIDQLDAQITAAPEAQRVAVTANIGPQRDNLLTQQGLFRQRIDQLQVDSNLQSGGAQLVTPAALPTTPIKPTPFRSGVLAAFIGLVFGIALAFVFEYFDDSIKTKEDLERAVHGSLPTLGLIPAVSTWKNRVDSKVISRLEPKSPAAEAYRTLRTSIQFMSLDRQVRILQFTSPSASEGKTTTVANLGVALAGAGQRVLVTCCDLRRPRIHEFFGMSNAVGFTSVIVKDVGLTDAIQAVPGVEGLYVLASGPLPPNPSELLSSERAAEVLSALAAKFDIVLLDTPPVLPVTDAAVLSSRVDGIVVVATARTTNRRELSRAVELLHQIDAPLVGTVLNGVTADGGYNSSYYYRADTAETRSPRTSDRVAVLPGWHRQGTFQEVARPDRSTLRG